MAEVKVKLSLPLEKGRGEMELEHGPNIPLSSTSDDYGVAPYQMLLGALGYCLFWTLRDILIKMQVDFGQIDVEIRGDKVKEKVAYLEWAKVNFDIESAEENKDKIAKAMELAKKYCSINYTLQHVAKIDVTFDLK